VRSKSAHKGEGIFVLGYPMISLMGEEVKLTTVVVSSKTGYQVDITSYQVSAPVQGGNSGGQYLTNREILLELSMLK
jgi:hypothetical protein